MPKAAADMNIVVRIGPSGLEKSDNNKSMQVIFGIHAVEEALAARGRAFEYVAVAGGRGDARIQKITQLCRSTGVPVLFWLEVTIFYSSLR